MASSMHVRSSDVELRAGIPNQVRAYLKQYVRCLKVSSKADRIQALLFDEIREMADRASLFKYASQGGSGL